MKDILSTYYECTLSAIAHILNVPGHFSLFWYMELVPKVCLHPSVAPHMKCWWRWASQVGVEKAMGWMAWV
jgi:hypothetical protein